MTAAAEIQEVLLNNGYEIHKLKPAIQDRSTKLDLAVAIGGDGTFLRAAGWIRNSIVPLIGFNSDPESSQGKGLQMDGLINLRRAHSKCIF